MIHGPATTVHPLPESMVPGDLAHMYMYTEKAWNFALRFHMIRMAACAKLGLHHAPAERTASGVASLFDFVCVFGGN